MSAKWIQHNGKSIMYVDFRGLRDEQIEATVLEEARLISQSFERVLVLANVQGATTASLDKVKRIGKDSIRPHVARSALVGVTGLKEVLMRAYNAFAGSDSHAFATEAEALEWLVK